MLGEEVIVGNAQCAGEHHGHRRGGQPKALRALAHHPQCRDITVFQIAAQLQLQRFRTALPVVVRVPFQQHERCKIA